MAYTRDNAWKIAGLNEVNPSLSMSYGYDDRNRLTTSNIWGTYAYDVNSNRTSYLGSLGPLSYTYGTTNNQLLTYKNGNVSVDAMGNIISKNGLSLTYDDWGRMRTSNNGSSVIYTYGVNGLDERVSKTNGTSTYYYIYAGVGQLLGIYNVSGQAVDEMVYLNDKPIASVRSGTLYNIETDNLNTPVRVLDQNNNIDWSWEGKEPFGLSQPTQAIVSGTNFIFNLRFPGQYADQETGLFQNGYREYDPTTGRYMEVDPLGLYAGWNPYNYVENNILNQFDLLGLRADTDICVGMTAKGCMYVGQHLSPDYAQFSISFYIVSGNISVTGDKIILSGGISRNYTNLENLFKFGFSFDLGVVNTACTDPNARRRMADQILQGFSQSLGYYYYGGSTEVYSPGSGSATQLGIGMGLSVNPGGYGKTIFQFNEGKNNGN
jgi:RHS repeat-associated protein